MKKALDVNHINPFLQSSIHIMESVAQMKLTVGKPSLHNLEFEGPIYAIQVGVTGEMKGQIVLSMKTDSAKKIASNMMCGMPVEEMDEMACSALNELSNMIMGNTATIFSTQGILIDITPPLAVLGDNVKLKSDVEGLKVPLLYEGEEYIGLHVCVYKD